MTGWSAANRFYRDVLEPVLQLIAGASLTDRQRAAFGRSPVLLIATAPKARAQAFGFDGRQVVDVAVVDLPDACGAALAKFLEAGLARPELRNALPALARALAIGAAQVVVTVRVDAGEVTADLVADGDAIAPTRLFSCTVRPWLETVH